MEEVVALLAAPAASIAAPAASVASVTASVVSVTAFVALLSASLASRHASLALVIASLVSLAASLASLTAPLPASFVTLFALASLITPHFANLWSNDVSSFFVVLKLLLMIWLAWRELLDVQQINEGMVNSQ